MTISNTTGMKKVVFAMNEYEPKPKKNGKSGKFDFLADFVDTLDIGTTILPVSEKEKGRDGLLP